MSDAPATVTRMTDPRRPALSPALSGAELARWYWLKDELVELARTLGVRTSGGKELLTRRLVAALDGAPFDEPAPARATAGSRQLSGPLTESTVVPPGQRCSQVVRGWFAEQLGAPFRFDAAMREFFAQADGTTTLGDALAHHRATRDRGPQEIGGQFELNRFTRAWHAAHPDGSRAELLRDWETYRATPVDERRRA